MELYENESTRKTTKSVLILKCTKGIYHLKKKFYQSELLTISQQKQPLFLKMRTESHFRQRKSMLRTFKERI